MNQWLVVAAAVGCCALAPACDLNPQPLPPQSLGPTSEGGGGGGFSNPGTSDDAGRAYAVDASVSHDAAGVVSDAPTDRDVVDSAMIDTSDATASVEAGADGAEED